MDLQAHIYAIGLPGPRIDGAVDGMGFKAFNLARMASIGLPVPQAFILGTAVQRARCADPTGFRAPLRALLESQVERLEAACGLELGSGRKPLLVSVRSGAPISMPGMMDTVLNVGLTDATLRGLLRLTGNPRLAWDSYRRLIHQFAEVVHHAPPEPFNAALRLALEHARVSRPAELDFRALASLSRSYLDVYESVVGRPFPQDPLEQLLAASEAVFDSWQSPRATTYRQLHDINDRMGTAVTVQRMVFGNAGGTSGSGVGFTRNPANGDPAPYLDFRFNSQGEDVVSGQHSASDAARLAIVLPHVHAHLQALGTLLERQFGDVQEFEFTVQDGVLYLLQTRDAKRTPWAALRIAVDQVNSGAWSPATALERLAGVDVAQIARTHLVADPPLERLAAAIPASVGVAAGAIALDAARAGQYAAAGQACILVRNDFSTTDLPGIKAAAGILTARGNRTAHAAVIARQLGKPCLVGCGELAIDLQQRTISFGERRLQEGDALTVDSENGLVFAGAGRIERERPDAWLDALATWACVSGQTR